ncbi:MAG: acetyl-CoA carboxylase biotin carboxyl carrier protein [Verrucomicrobiales bacterium]|nr:acetyl-CoA carboxylase biotin carboxyl carrier protein [Verrucomicrobiales bacterium]
MRKNAISEFELERQEFKIRLKRATNGGPAVTFDDTGGPIQAQVLPAPAASPAPPPPRGGDIPQGTIEIKSPMIGTLYRSPSPESSPYVDVGSEVGPDTVVCIIEAMKVMNEIKAEVRGVITQVLADNSKPVEFGQPLFKVRPL